MDRAGNITGIILGCLYFAVMESSSVNPHLEIWRLLVEVTDVMANLIDLGRETGLPR